MAGSRHKYRALLRLAVAAGELLLAGLAGWAAAQGQVSAPVTIDVVSADGTTLAPPSAADANVSNPGAATAAKGITTVEGLWTFGTPPDAAGDYPLLLNGSNANGGFADRLQVTNGNLYAKTKAGKFSVRWPAGASWVASRGAGRRDRRDRGQPCCRIAADPRQFAGRNTRRHGRRDDDAGRRNLHRAPGIEQPAVYRARRRHRLVARRHTGRRRDARRKDHRAAVKLAVSIRVGDALACLRAMPADSVHCCVTSPPYWGLRDYGTPPQIWGGDPACRHRWSIETRKGMTGGTASAKVHAKGAANFQAFGATKQRILRALRRLARLARPRARLPALCRSSRRGHA